MIDLLSVHADSTYATKGWIAGADYLIPCAVGRGGIGLKNGEGDGITPIGLWPLRRVLYRPDRVARPITGLPVMEIAPDDGWCDDPAHPAYNLPVKRPFAASHEEMWRDDHAYDLVVVMGYNDDPVQSGGGSAIFWHLAQPDWRATAGCVATDHETMLWLLAQCHTATMMRITAHLDNSQTC